MQFFEKLKVSYCTLFLTGPALISKSFEDGIYVIGTVQTNRKEHISGMKVISIILKHHFLQMVRQQAFYCSGNKC